MILYIEECDISWYIIILFDIMFWCKVNKNVEMVVFIWYLVIFF